MSFLTSLTTAVFTGLDSLAQPTTGIAGQYSITHLPNSDIHIQVHGAHPGEVTLHIIKHPDGYADIGIVDDVHQLPEVDVYVEAQLRELMKQGRLRAKDIEIRVDFEKVVGLVIVELTGEKFRELTISRKCGAKRVEEQAEDTKGALEGLGQIIRTCWNELKNGYVEISEVGHLKVE